MSTSSLTCYSNSDKCCRLYITNLDLKVTKSNGKSNQNIFAGRKVSINKNHYVQNFTQVWNYEAEFMVYNLLPVYKEFQMKISGTVRQFLTKVWISAPLANCSLILACLFAVAAGNDLWKKQSMSMVFIFNLDKVLLKKLCPTMNI